VLEPFATIGLVVLAAGGYVAAMAVLLKDVLNVRKLQLAIEELREKSRTRQGMVHWVAAEEIEKYEPEQSLYAARAVPLAMIITACALILLLLSVGYFVNRIRASDAAVGSVATQRDEARARVKEHSARVISLEQKVAEMEASLKQKEEELQRLRALSSSKPATQQRAQRPPAPPIKREADGRTNDRSITNKKEVDGRRIPSQELQTP
jgi:hypothetical protein